MSNQFSFATREDGPGILNIMESDIARGEIQLLYTRRPNPYDSFMEESSDAVIGVFKREGDVVGTVVGVPRKMYLDGQQRKVCYVTNMKKHHDLKTHINWIRAFGDIYDKTLPDVCFCSIVKENEEPFPYSLFTSRELPIRSRSWLTMLIPSPVPSMERFRSSSIR